MSNVRNVERVRRALDLHVAAGAERHLLAFRQRELQLLDERRDVAVRDDAARHLRTSKISGAISIFMSRLTFTWHARRWPRFASPRADVPGLRRQEVAAALADDHFADAAGALAAAGGRNEDLVLRERTEQRAASRQCSGKMPCHQNK